MGITLFELLDDNQIGRRYERKQDDITIGRLAENDIQILRSEISKRHVRIYMDGKTCRIQDLGSSNGTWVNGEPVTRGARQLHNGDVINLATVVTLQFVESTGGTAMPKTWSNAPQWYGKPIFIDMVTNRVLVNRVELDPPLTWQQHNLLTQLYFQGRVVTFTELSTQLSESAWWDKQPDRFSSRLGDDEKRRTLDGIVQRLRERIAEVDASREYITVIPGVGYALNNTFDDDPATAVKPNIRTTAMLESAQKSVFISYRRALSKHLARAIYQNLQMNEWDVFLDVNTIDSGDFDRIILEQIAARAHFILLISERSLERCANPGDWLLREMQEAVRLKRNIVPVIEEGVSFSQEIKHLPEDLRAIIRKKNALPLSHFFFDAAMEMLRTRFLKAPEYIETTDVRAEDQPEVQQRIETLQSQMTAQPAATLAHTHMAAIQVRQQVTSEPSAHSQQLNYDIVLHMEAEQAVIDQIAYVRYQMLPAFPDFIQKLDDRATNFRVQATYSENDYTIPIEVHFADGSIGRVDYDLKPDGETA